MPVLESKIAPGSAEFASNRAAMLEKIEQLRALEEKSQKQAESKREKFEKRGQILPRERVNLLLDRGSPFLELSSLAGYKQHDDKDGSLAGGNTIIGIGFVEGTRCLISASNSAVKGGTVTPWGLRKTLRAQEIVAEQNLPVISLVESGGANLNYQSEIFVDGGKVFANQARLSAQGIPQVTIVNGSSTAGGAYMPGLSDHVIMVRKRAKVFLAGPPLLKAATGEIAEEEELGGADMHAQVAGTTEYVAEDDLDAVRLAREVIRNLHWNANQPSTGSITGAAFSAPAYDIDELCGAVPVDYKTPFDCREVIARVVDASDFLEFKAEYDQQTICGRAAIHGMGIGIISNNGPITHKGAVKAAQFIQGCCQSNTPIIYLQNTTGYMVGTEAEQAGIVKHGSKMLQAVANATVPQITVVMAGSFGAGNYGMCGRGLSPQFIFSWPTNVTSVMGGEQAAGVMEVVTRDKHAKIGQKVNEEMLAMMKKQIVDRFAAESDAWQATARLWDDGVIDPRDTRRVLAFTLATCLEGRNRTLHPITFGVARM